MVEKLLLTLILLVPGALILRAQDYPVSPPDGPALRVKEDTSTLQPHSYSLMELSPAPDIRLPSTLVPPPFETKEQKAARINLRTEADVMRSVQLNLMGYQPPRFSLPEKSTALCTVTTLAGSIPYLLITMMHGMVIEVFNIQ